MSVFMQKKNDKIKKHPYLPNLIFHQCYPKYPIFFIGLGRINIWTPCPLVCMKLYFLICNEIVSIHRMSFYFLKLTESRTTFTLIVDRLMDRLVPALHCTVICPFCITKKVTFSRPADLKNHTKEAQ